MSQEMLLDCISKHLPKLEVLAGGYKATGFSGSTTGAMTAPSVLINLPIERFEKLADEHLQADCLTAQDLHLKTSPVILKHAPLTVEQDVVAASVMHIIATVLPVLEALYPEGWHYRNEVTTKVKGGGKNDKDTSVRFDTIFRKITQNAEPGDIIAVIEFKRIGLIRYQDFKNTIVPATATREAIDNMKD
ncbi:hypothetical protein T440DRAFT_376356, partial [Plenodomus tracheiphilus IPT5]